MSNYLRLKISNTESFIAFMITEYNKQQTHSENNFLIIGSQGIEEQDFDILTIRIADQYKNHVGLVSNTDITTDIDGVGGANVTVPIAGNTVYMDDSFVANGDAIQCNYNGRAKVFGSVYVTGNGVRYVAHLHIQLNDADLPNNNNPIGSNAYIRNSGGGDDKQTLIVSTVIDCAIGDNITLLWERGGTPGGVVTMVKVGTSILLVERI